MATKVRPGHGRCSSVHLHADDHGLWRLVPGRLRAA
jgi:hypothetical protein